MKMIFFDIDTQIDFIMPEGALHVPEAETLLPVYERLSQYALKKNIPVLASADAHPQDDPEFKQFPPHCVKGTPGQNKIPQTLPERFHILANDSAPLAEDIFSKQHILFEKQTFDVFTNPKTEKVLKHLKPERVVVYGVATDYCVKAAVEGLLARDYQVWLVHDAIKAVDPAQGEKVLQMLKDKGVQLISSDQVMAY